VTTEQSTALATNDDSALGVRNPNALLATVEGADLAVAMEQVWIQGDLARLSAPQRVAYYRTVCQTIGLNPFTKPFAYISLNGKLTLYPLKDCADQLRSLRGISVGIESRQRTEDDQYEVVASGTDRHGRRDSALGVVDVRGMAGEALANAKMKAETKAKRRLTLSLAGLGMLDESEVDSVGGAQRVTVDDEGNIVEGEYAEDSATAQSGLARLAKRLGTAEDRTLPVPQQEHAHGDGVKHLHTDGHLAHRHDEEQAPVMAQEATPEPEPTADTPDVATEAPAAAGDLTAATLQDTPTTEQALAGMESLAEVASTIHLPTEADPADGGLARTQAIEADPFTSDGQPVPEPEVDGQQGMFAQPEAAKKAAKPRTRKPRAAAAAERTGDDTLADVPVPVAAAKAPGAQAWHGTIMGEPAADVADASDAAMVPGLDAGHQGLRMKIALEQGTAIVALHGDAEAQYGMLELERADGTAVRVQGVMRLVPWSTPDGRTMPPYRRIIASSINPVAT
jgi:hypothetical protein